jgi:hypothetical protein
MTDYIEGKPTLQQHYEFLSALEDLKDDILKGSIDLKYHANDGICGVLFYSYEVMHAVALVKDFSKGWSYHSGNAEWPVPDTDDGAWEGRGLAYRMDLINYMIEKARNDSGECG